MLSQHPCSSTRVFTTSSKGLSSWPIRGSRILHSACIPECRNVQQSIKFSEILPIGRHVTLALDSFHAPVWQDRSTFPLGNYAKSEQIRNVAETKAEAFRVEVTVMYESFQVQHISPKPVSWTLIADNRYSTQHRPRHQSGVVRCNMLQSKSWTTHFLQRPKLVVDPIGCLFHLSRSKLAAANLAVQKLVLKGAVSALKQSDTTNGIYTPVFLVSKTCAWLTTWKCTTRIFLYDLPNCKWGSFLRQGNWMISLDLQEAALDVCTCKLLTICSQQAEGWVQSVLPLGIPIALWLFTKIINPVI